MASGGAGHDDFQPWLDRWGLQPDGPPSATRSGRFLPVRYRGESAMLKVVTEPEERDGAKVLAWWAGQGAAPVYGLDDDAVLLARAHGPDSLKAMAHQGQDREATIILCRVAARLHAKDPGDRPATVVPLESWFSELWPAARGGGDLLATGAAVADRLLAERTDPVVLHGDIHHDNVLDFGPGPGEHGTMGAGASDPAAGAAAGGRRWLAIDPKGLYGERTFDFVNLLRNPDGATALAPGRFARQVEIIAAAANLDAVRLVAWTLAFTALSAAWIYGDGDEPTLDLAVAAMARSYLSARSYDLRSA